jgi:Rod binding domain-containing protein
MGMADEYFARSIAAHGGFGLAKMISAGLSRKSGGAPEPVAAGAAKASD